MSEQVWIRPFKEGADGKLLVEWLYAGREGNRFDPEAFSSRQMKVYVAFDSSGVVGFVPVLNGNQVESLAFRPGLPPVTQAKAFRAWQAVFVHESFANGTQDAFFVTFDERVLEFSAKYGWKKVVVPMMNLHFAGLEGSPHEEGGS